jgi:hypothetical protein
VRRVELHPPARNLERYIAKSRKSIQSGLHLFVGADEDAPTDLPPPEQWIIARVSEEMCAEMIEEYVEFIDQDGKTCRLQADYVKHFWWRDDDVLPFLVAIVTASLVLKNGTVFGRESGFDRRSGIDFRIQPEIAACVPEPGTITDDDVWGAMRFLMEEWLADVTADFTNKCIALANALTIIERSLLDKRPVFFVTAGRAGTGKTTLLQMLTKAVTGIATAAARWTDNEEERKKALFSWCAVHSVGQYQARLANQLPPYRGLMYDGTLCRSQTRCVRNNSHVGRDDQHVYRKRHQAKGRTRQTRSCHRVDDRPVRS